MQGQWHLWDYRNQRFHGQGGIAETAEHALLNDRIDQEFAAGWEGMTMVNAQIHSQGQSADSIKALPLAEKRDWISSVDAGRKSLRVCPPDDYAQMRDLLRAHVVHR